MKIDIADLAETSHLAGALQGRKLFARLSDGRFEYPHEPTPLFLDFQGVEIATASYLRESVLKFKNHMRANRTTLYPILANASETVEEEVAVIAEATNDAFLTCELGGDERVTDVRLLGSLDPKQRMTFDAINEIGSADAPSLMKRFGAQEKTTRTTAWNNRLASLSTRGLIKEFSQGRAKRYEAMFGEEKLWA